MGKFLAGVRIASTTLRKAIVGGVAGILFPTSIDLLLASIAPEIAPLRWGVLGMGVATLCPVRVEQSLEVLRVEAERTRKERKAFMRFASRVDDVTPETLRPNTPPVLPTDANYSADDQQPNSSIESVRDLYVETVMGMAHYGEDYGDSIEESLAAEFGDDMATALMYGNALTPSLQTTLVTAARETANGRAAYQQTLTREHDALTENYHALQELADHFETIREDISDPVPFDALIESHENLYRLDTEADAILRDRQKQIADHPQQAGIALYEYLHTEYDWTYPVLADTLTLQAEISDLGHQLTAHLTSYK